VTLSTFTLLVAMCFGSVPGYLVGQWKAETFRAKFDMKRTWENRRAYRE
jgi:hypothetical protein